ncbi:hypothetical protein CesoFtcFv8_022901 [Champsocephalus esox]|uniref:Uncharacterized protein n=2 Tax=Champsocephalus TaxID=52236 RepID=A0AAN8CGG6_CHAGU|nr:hypothetical protein CesoFtcFv8_022901 [Champsocephalus esox]KAK5903282.1 hypothetical protein CgunFtcFv8_007076 [Champsocephalus gunnari]
MVLQYLTVFRGLMTVEEPMGDIRILTDSADWMEPLSVTPVGGELSSVTEGSLKNDKNLLLAARDATETSK